MAMTERYAGIAPRSVFEGAFRAGLENVLGEMEELGLGHWLEVELFVGFFVVYSVFVFEMVGVEGEIFEPIWHVKVLFFVFEPLEPLFSFGVWVINLAG